MRWTIAARKEAAAKLIEGGMSQRQAAKVLGVSHTTILNDVANNLPKGGKKVATDSAVIKLRKPKSSTPDDTEETPEASADKRKREYAEAGFPKTGNVPTSGFCCRILPTVVGIRAR